MSARPSSINPAKFKSEATLNSTTSLSASAFSFQKRLPETSEEIAREMEKEINKLLEASAAAHQVQDFPQALAQAKKAADLNKKLELHRKNANPKHPEQNIDLTYCAHFNLANQYHANKMHDEALRWYQHIAAHKRYAHVGRLRVNIGNVLYEQKKYAEAVQSYQMAVDSLPSSTGELQLKIQGNIANCWIHLGKFSEAAALLMDVVSACPEPKYAINLIVCLCVLEDKKRLMNAFVLMLKMRKAATLLYQLSGPPHSSGSQPSDGPPDSSGGPGHGNPLTRSNSPTDIAIMRSSEGDDEPHDEFYFELQARKKQTDRAILTAAQLVAPIVDSDVTSGYDWVIETLVANGSTDLANQLEVTKAVAFMKKRQFDKAFKTLKSFEMRDTEMAAAASTNLSFLYFLEGDYDNAEKHANTAINADKSNAKALINKGNCLAKRDNLEEAQQAYHSAFGYDSIDCAEAIYNLGLTYKQMNNIEMALHSFFKLNSMLPNDPEVVFQIASLHEKKGAIDQAIEYFKQLNTLLQESDPGVAAKLGDLYHLKGDDNMAYIHYHESFKLFPSNLKVVSWLGAYYIKTMAPDKALPFFQRAMQLDPQNPRWQLMVASSYKCSNQPAQAYSVYLDYHNKYPYDSACLRELVEICGELNMKDERHQFSVLLRVIEQEKAANRQIEENAVQTTQASDSTQVTNKQEEEETDIGLLLP
ncbi:intraflagellar transport protein 88-like [Pelomyxa schiedti]|nr:intraflagellar transport protein 88-like [Pelomyxa schiedti]